MASDYKYKTNADGTVSCTCVANAPKDTATGKRKQRHLTTRGKTKAQAKKEMDTKVAQIEADVSRGVYVDPVKMTVGQFLDYFMEQSGPPEESSRETYERNIRLHLKPLLGQLPLGELKPRHVGEFITALKNKGLELNKKPYATTFLSLNYNILNRVLKFAVEREILHRNVCYGFPGPQVEKKEVQPHTRKELRTLTTGFKDAFDRRITVMMKCTGMRIGEVLAINYKKNLLLDHDPPLLKVANGVQDVKKQAKIGKTKSKRNRTIELVPEAVEACKEQLLQLKKDILAAGGLVKNGGKYQDNGLLFARPDGTPHSSKSYREHWRYYARKMVEGAHPHRCRHSTATFMMEQEVPLKDIQEMLGHSSGKITNDIYGHVSPKSRHNAVQKLAEALAEEE